MYPIVKESRFGVLLARRIIDVKAVIIITAHILLHIITNGVDIFKNLFGNFSTLSFYHVHRLVSSEDFKKSDPAPKDAGPLPLRIVTHYYSSSAPAVLSAAGGPREISSAITQTEFRGLPSLSL